jgi:hypothetical protein
MVINLNAHIDKFFPHQYSLQVVLLKEITDFNNGNSSQSKVGSLLLLRSESIHKAFDCSPHTCFCPQLQLICSLNDLRHIPVRKFGNWGLCLLK